MSYYTVYVFLYSILYTIQCGNIAPPAVPRLAAAERSAAGGSRSCALTDIQYLSSQSSSPLCHNGHDDEDDDDDDGWSHNLLLLCYVTPLKLANFEDVQTKEGCWCWYIVKMGTRPTRSEIRLSYVEMRLLVTMMMKMAALLWVAWGKHWEKKRGTSEEGFCHSCHDDNDDDNDGEWGRSNWFSNNKRRRITRLPMEISLALIS